MGWPRTSRTVVLTAIGTGLTACVVLSGVDDLMVDPSASPHDTPADLDGGVLGSVDATIVDGCGMPSCELLPDGFQLVALGARDDGCPSGFGQPIDAVEQPSIDPGACTCGCDLTQQPVCEVAAGETIRLFYGPVSSGICPSTGQDVPTGCSTDGFHGPFLAYERRYVAPAATLTGGACTATSVKDDTKLKTLRARVCQATVLPQCEGKTCVPEVAPLAACIAATGARDCPPAWPTRHHVGTSASFTCGCTCTVAGDCSAQGTLSYFASSDCSGRADLIYPVDGGCQPTGGSNDTFGSHRYDPAPPSNVTCQTGGAADGPTLAQEMTVCCR